MQSPKFYRLKCLQMVLLAVFERHGLGHSPSRRRRLYSVVEDGKWMLLLLLSNVGVTIVDSREILP